MIDLDLDLDLDLEPPLREQRFILLPGPRIACARIRRGRMPPGKEEGVVTRPRAAPVGSTGR